MAQNATQQTVFGDPLEEQLYIKTTGRIIRPFKRMVGQVVEEYKLHADADGLAVNAMDPANVCGIEVQVEADAFESYDVNGAPTFGVDNSTLGSALQHTRYGRGTNDPVTVVASDTRLEAETDRDVAGTETTVTERVPLIDPNSIREEPDVPDFDFDASVDLDPEAFIEAVGMCDARGEHIELIAAEAFTVRQSTDYADRNIELDVSVDGEAKSMYSGEYIADIAAVLNNGYVDDITLKWSDEFPLIVEFEREGVYHGQVMTAPRIGH